MLKHRVIPTLLTDGVQCVKPVAFQRPYRKLNTMTSYIQVMERRNIDELIIIDIEATPNKREPNYALIRSFADKLFMPLCVGGGIHHLDHIKKLLDNGADKVCINSGVRKEDFIYHASRRFGSQAIVWSLDVTDGCIRSNDEICNISLKEACENMQEAGVGEILLTDTHSDGVMDGYSYSLIKRISSYVTIPVIANGGCGEPEHMAKALLAGASAVAAGSMFLYTEHTPKDCVEYLNAKEFAVRL